MASLNVISGTLKDQRFPLDRDDVTIGRAPDNVVVINDPSASAHHCVIRHSAGICTVQDLGSTNGTLVNGEEIKEAVLRHGDLLYIGSVEAVFEDENAIPPMEDPQQIHKRPEAASSVMTFGTRKDRSGWWTVFLVTAILLTIVGATWFFLDLFFE